MSKKQSVGFGDRWFWVYDVSLGALVKHVIDAAEASSSDERDWLSEQVESWRVTIGVGDLAFLIDPAWSPAQLQLFVDLVEEACGVLAGREAIPATEVEAWPILDDMRLFARGESEVHTGPVIELGRAIGILESLGSYVVPA